MMALMSRAIKKGQLPPKQVRSRIGCALETEFLLEQDWAPF
jgi:hypothetical protein